jgi:hypothetical protein
MKTHELMLGNYFMYDKKLVYIAEIHKDNRVTIYDGNGFEKSLPLECLKPIALNYEELEKLGFLRTHKGFGRMKYVKNIEIDINTEGICSYGLWVIKYVHKLQNFYLAKTEKKLFYEA